MFATTPALSMIDSAVQVRETTTPEPSIAPVEVSAAELEQMVRERAHAIFAERSERYSPGTPEDDWEVALHEIEPYVTVVN